MAHAELPSFADRVRATLDHRKLHLTVTPTEKCNFRCVYCYEDFSVGRMKRPVVEGLKRLISIRAPELLELQISWFGGEPLLQKDIVLEVSEHARTACDRSSALFISDMTTNGYLLDVGLARDLAAQGVRRFQISLDGDRETHGQTRKLADGGNSFDRIWGNLLALQGSDLDLEVTIRVHYQAGGKGELPGFVDRLMSIFGEDQRFRLFVRPISPLGGPRDAEVRRVSTEDNAQMLGALQQRAKSDEDKIATWALGRTSMCYAAAPNHFLIRADGRIGKCTVAMAKDVNAVGMLRPDGSMQLDQAKLGKWSRGLKSGVASELACPLHGIA